MPERILVPLDGSLSGEAAIKIVENIITKFAPEIKVEVTLLQVLSSLAHYVVAGDAGVQIPYSDNELNRLKTEAADYLKKAGERLTGIGASLDVRVATGNAADEILKASEEIHADLIAMATHGRSGISRLALGSVTEKVLRGSTRPVMVVRSTK